MMRIIAVGLWSASPENGRETWRYLTVSGMVWQWSRKSDAVVWEHLMVPAAAKSGVAYLMQAQGGGRLDPATSDYASALEHLGGVPDMVRNGLTELSEDDVSDGWHGDLRRVWRPIPQGFEPDDFQDTGEFMDSGVVCEPEPVTAEIPEIPPEPDGEARSSSVRVLTIPAMVPVRELEAFRGFRRPKHFRDAKGRKLAYVATDGVRVLVAYRATYEGGDSDLEQRVSDYAHGLEGMK